MENPLQLLNEKISTFRNLYESIHISESASEEFGDAFMRQIGKEHEREDREKLQAEILIQISNSLNESSVAEKRNFRIQLCVLAVATVAATPVIVEFLKWAFQLWMP